MRKVIKIKKATGETPLQSIERFQADNPEYKNEKISYAGRLDPMAEGELLLLIDDANKEKEKYLNLDKKYTFKILFGVSTDTGDVLGKVKNYKNIFKSPDLVEIQNISKGLEGKLMQKYPWFSSKVVEGKPLFEWFRKERTSEVERPIKEIKIYSLDAKNDIETISKANLWKYIEEKINLVNGDFRQKEVLESWKKYFEKDSQVENYFVLKMEIFCSSGTYVRVVVKETGKQLGIPTLALHIIRDQIVFDKKS